MRIGLLFFLALFIFDIVGQNISAVGVGGQLEIGNWNIEWYGNKSSGPANEALQQQNVTNVLKSSQIDIWGLCEISDALAWDSMLAKLPDYNGVISTWSQTQKTALLYKKQLFQLYYSRHILQSKSINFANGRLPLEVALLFNNNGKTDTIYIFVIHLKANVGTLSERRAAYNFRANSSADLKGYLDTFAKGKKIAVIGDWNDDLDTGVLDSTATPFRNLLNDSNRYFFTSKILTDTKEKSTVSYPNVIDHQCISIGLKRHYFIDSSKVWRIDQNIPNFANTTSDHYPVFSRYTMNLTSVEPVFKIEKGERFIYFNGINFVSKKELRNEMFQIYNMSGKKLFDGRDLKNFRSDQNQFYLVHCMSDKTKSIQKIYVP